MSLIAKAFIVGLVWLGGTVICNPFFENKKLANISLMLAAFLSIVFIFLV